MTTPVLKQSFIKKLAAFFKDAEFEEASVKKAGDEDDTMEAMKAHHAKLGDAIAAYGDGAGLAADHPLHALKALHKELGEKLAASVAKSTQEAEAEAARKAAEDAAAHADNEEDGGTVTKAEVQVEVNKALVDMQKKLDAAEARATEAENIAKAERDMRELEGEKMTLRKFRHVPLDVDKDAPVFLKMRKSDKEGYDLVMAKLNAAEAVAKKVAVLEQDLGSPLGGDGQSAWAEIEAEADKLVAKGEAGLTKEKAIDRVMKSRTDLVKRYEAEKSGQVA